MVVDVSAHDNAAPALGKTRPSNAKPRRGAKSKADGGEGARADARAKTTSPAAPAAKAGRAGAARRAGAGRRHTRR